MSLGNVKPGGGMKETSGWVLGTDLSPGLRKEVLRAFVHRSVGSSPGEKRADGTWARPPDQFASDEEWLANTKFAVTKAGKLNQRVRYCESNPTWPNNPELRKGRSKNPANVGGRAAGNLQADGRQGNPDGGGWTDDGPRRIHLVSEIQRLVYSIKTWNKRLMAAYRVDEDDLPSPKQYENLHRTRADLQEMIDSLEADLKRMKGYGPEKRLAEFRDHEPRQENPAHDYPDSASFNLDAHSPSELEAIANKLTKEWYKYETVFGKRTTAQLKKYARTKARAMKLREAGQISEAVKLENQCDRIYKQLPKWAKW